MTKDEAIAKLKVCVEHSKRRDAEGPHAEADGILCELLRALGYGEVVDVWEDVNKWYA